MTSPANHVSVVIPVFNGADYLAEAIASVLAQSTPPAEVIVVDDGSTDGTADVAQTFADRIRFVRRSHSGIAATRNHGLSLAQNQWIAFLDADDVWVEQKLSLQLALAGSDPSSEIIFGGVEQFVSPELTVEERQRLAIKVEKSSAPHCGAMLVRRTVFDRIGGFDTTLRVGEFIDWFTRARDSGLKIASVPEVVLRRRWHRTNSSRNNRAAFTDLTGVLKKAMDRQRKQEATS